MSNVGLIIQREFSSRIKKRSFIIMCLLGPLLISLFSVLAIKVSNTYEKQKVLIVDPHEITGLYWNDTHTKWCDFEVQFKNISDAEFNNSDFDVLVYINRKIVENNTVQIFYKDKPNPYSRADIIRQVETRLEGLKLEVTNIDPDSYYKLKQALIVKDKNINGEDVRADQNKSNIGFVFGALIFFFIFNFGVHVMRGVIEEKSNRIVEIMVSTVKPIQLMTGKIIGIGMAALLQFAIWTALTAVILTGIREQVYPDVYAPDKQVAQTAQTSHSDLQGPTHIEVNEMGQLIYEAVNYTGMISFFLFFMIVGYFFYAGIYASIGAAVDNETDGQQYLFPVTLPLILGFVAAYVTATNPDGAIAETFSIIPFTSPIVMMVRLPFVYGSANEWQLYLSMGVLMLSALLMFYLSARVYKKGILMYGKKAGLSQIWRWAVKGN